MAKSATVKIVLLFSRDANQRALAHRIASIAPLEAIIACTPAATGGTRGLGQIARLARGVAGLPLRKAWFGMLDRYARDYPEFPLAPQLTVTDINGPAVAAAVRDIAPDLAIVSGTNLLKQPLIDTISRTGRIMNLHTGISPYVKGGPNCTNWCLSTNRSDLIGNTVMWIDRGIDSGNLVATERTPLDGTESLTELHVKVLDHAHSLLLRCVARFIAGASLPDVPQAEIDSGQLFLSRHWTAAAAAKAVMNFHLNYRRMAGGGSNLRLVSPESS